MLYVFIVHVYVVDPPVFVDFTVDLGVLTGDEVTLYCMATSQDENVNVTWSANFTEESTNHILPEPVVKHDGNLTNSTITFTATLKYNGTYICTAMNRVGTISNNFTLSVISKSDIVYHQYQHLFLLPLHTPLYSLPLPSLSSSSPLPPPPPTAIVGVDSVEAVVGTNTSLFCNATGNPNLVYEWLTTIRGYLLNYRFDNVTGPRVSGDRTNTLVFTNVSSRDDAEYSCVVSLFGCIVGRASGNLTTLGELVCSL